MLVWFFFLFYLEDLFGGYFLFVDFKAFGFLGKIFFPIWSNFNRNISQLEKAWHKLPFYRQILADHEKNLCSFLFIFFLQDHPICVVHPVVVQKVALFSLLTLNACVAYWNREQLSFNEVIWIPSPSISAYVKRVEK